MAADSQTIIASLLTAAFNSVMQQQAAVRLLRAVADDDHDGFKAALNDNADVNAAGGAPLHVAAYAKNSLMMRYLVTAGADIAYALDTLKKQQSAIPRTKDYDDYWDNYKYKYKSKADEKRYKELGAAMTTLEKFDKLYRTELAPLEAIRLQNETLMELRRLKGEVTEAIHGRPLDKKKLPAPAPLQKKTP